MKFPITPRPGSESRHNLIYWRYGDYAGVGPGAHGRLMLNGTRMATATIKLPERWQDGVMRKRATPSPDFVEVPDGDAAREHLLMNLRLAEGIDLAAYELRWSVRPDAAKIAALVEQGLLSHDDDVLRATPQGPAGAQRRDRGVVELGRLALECLGRGADDMEAVGRHFQHRQAALRRAVGTESGKCRPRRQSRWGPSAPPWVKR